LDFTPSQKYDADKRSEMIKNSISLSLDGSGSYITTSSAINSSVTFTVNPYDKAAGAIEVTPDFHVYVKKKPNWIARFSMRKIFGWNWKDK
jgi:hypothetical protein